MKIVSYNINSIRKRLDHLETLINKHQPDIISLQETKVQDVDFPREAIHNLGYHAAFHGQKTHYGVATLMKTQACATIKGFSHDDETSQKRLIISKHRLNNGNNIHLINGYFPQGENRDHPTKFPAKIKFYQDLLRYLQQHHTPEELIVVLGDMNISPEDIDIGIGENNRKRWLQTGKCSFLPEERVMLNQLKAWGLTDSFRHLYPQQNSYTWFDYRSKGFEDEPKRGLRIDLILLTKNLLEQCNKVEIDYHIRGMATPSDHAPVVAEFGELRLV